jgi:hypothetical protein
MNIEEIKTKFKGFFVPDSEPDMVREVIKITKRGDFGVEVWIPPENGKDFFLRTTLESYGEFGFMTETLTKGKWHRTLKKTSSMMIFRPHSDGSLKMVNINKKVADVIFDDLHNWHITDWQLVAIDGISFEIKDTLEDNDLICAVVDWADKDGRTTQTRYGWRGYKSS